MTDLQDYLQVPNHLFQFITQGDYIRWKYGTEITSGGAVIQIGLTKSGRKNWTVEGYKGKYTLYWDVYPEIWVRINITYFMLHKQINVLSSMILEIMRELNISDKFKSMNEKIKKGILRHDKKLIDRENTKRKKKNIKLLRSKSLSNLRN